MKNTILILLSLIIISCKDSNKNSLAINTAPKNQQILKRYDVKSGIIKYKTTTSGKVMGSRISGSGTENVYFKNWGAVELVEINSHKTTTMKFFGKEKIKNKNTHTIYKLDNGKEYHVNFDKAEIFLSRDTAMELMKETNSDVGHVGKFMLESMGGKKIGTENFLGYPCEIWDAMGSKQWIYKGVTLKIVSEMMGITTIKKAVEAHFNKTISNKHFELPNFPIVKSPYYVDDESYRKEKEIQNKNLKKMGKMSFSEFKKEIRKRDPEAKEMTEKELRYAYDLMLKMANNPN